MSPLDQNLCSSILLTTLLFLKIEMINLIRKAYCLRTNADNFRTFKFNFSLIRCHKSTNMEERENAKIFRKVMLNGAKVTKLFVEESWHISWSYSTAKKILFEIFISLFRRKIAMNFPSNILQSWALVFIEVNTLIQSNSASSWWDTPGQSNWLAFGRSTEIIR